MVVERIGVFPGSFDPFTNGHKEVALEALKLFDKLMIVVGCHRDKPGFIAVDKRLEVISSLFRSVPEVTVHSHKGLLADLLKGMTHVTLVRGLRGESDLSYEMPMAVTNKILTKGVSTIFIPTSPINRYLSSSLVREVASYGGDVTPFVPPEILTALVPHRGSE